MKKKKEQQYTLVLSMRNAFLYLFLFEADKKISFSARKKLSLKKDDLHFNLFQLERGFYDLIEKNLTKQGIIPHNIYFFLPTPFIYTQRDNLFYQKEKKFLPKRELIQSLLEKHQKNISQKTQRDIHKDGKTIPLHFRPISYFLNGHLVELNGKEISFPKVSELSVSLVHDFISFDTMKSFTHSIERSFHHNNLEFYSFALIFAKHKKEKDFVYLNIENFLTELWFYKNGKLESIASIPFGRIDFIQELSRSLHIHEDYAEKLFALIQQDQVLLNDRELLAQKGIFEQWFRQIFTLFQIYTQQHVLIPSSLVIDENAFLSEAILAFLQEEKEDELSQFLPRSQDLKLSLYRYPRGRDEKITLDHDFETFSQKIIAALGLLTQFKQEIKLWTEQGKEE